MIWEYKIVHSSRVDAWNREGQDGWELVQVLSTDHGWTVVFKRWA